MMLEDGQVEMMVDQAWQHIRTDRDAETNKRVTTIGPECIVGVTLGVGPSPCVNTARCSQ